MDPTSGEVNRLLHTKLSSSDATLADHNIFRYSILASAPVRKESGDDRLFIYEMEEMRIAWTMTTLPDLSGKDQWKTIDYFSTLQAGWVPDSGPAFLDILVKALVAGWQKLCDAIDDHLLLCVSLTTLRGLIAFTI